LPWNFLGLVGLPSFEAGIKEFICKKYLFHCHRIAYGIHLEFHDFHPMSNLNSCLVPCYLCGFTK
jgi:hypothetical protein